MTRNPSPGTITLIGSGEMSPSMGKVHRAVMSRIAEPVQAVFLDTPAGFELNADQISICDRLTRLDIVKIGQTETTCKKSWCAMREFFAS